MSTENQETTEQTKPKRRFKLDKKHIQGFIAGILLCAIAFTGLYYGTNGQFFKGEMYDNYRYVNSYLDFERYVEKSKLSVLVVFFDDSYSKENRNYIKDIAYVAQFYNGTITFAITDKLVAREHARRYVINKFPTYCIFRDGEIVSRKEGNLTLSQLFDWLFEEYGY